MAAPASVSVAHALLHMKPIQMLMAWSYLLEIIVRNLFYPITVITLELLV